MLWISDYFSFRYLPEKYVGIDTMFMNNIGSTIVSFNTE